MNDIIASSRKSDSLELILDELRAYGNPSVSWMDDGWYCRCKMHVASAGASFEVSSTFKEPTALVAAQVCMARIRETLAKYKETK